ncbi:MAG: ABC transporter substrate-binding protein, partial [Chloroflexota bacterium]|nr:ABC transporter substrate-binding protein [Chloroflexota bacterium]
EDGTEHTFTLQSGVKFHDGTDFSAEAVVFNLDRMVSPDSKSRLAGPRLTGFYESSEAVDATTVKIVFSQPNGAFLTDLSQNFMTMLSPAAVEKFSAEEIGRNPVGTGPFTFVEWVENSHIKMVRNEEYNWASPMFGRQGTAYLDSITFRIIPEDGARMAALESGELNYVDIVPTIDFTRIEEDSNYTTYSVPQPGVPYAYMLNTKRAPTDDLAVRQAINYAVDKEQVIDTLYQGLYTPAYGPLSPASFAYNPAVETMYPFDPEQAKQVLEEAGWVEGSDGIREKDGTPLEIEHYVFTDTKVAEVMQAQLEEVGIRSNVTLLEVGAVNEAATQGEASNLAPLPYRDADPAVLCVVLCIKNEGKGFAWTFHKNDELDSEIEMGQSTTDPAEREQHYGRAQILAMEEALLIPVYNNNGLTASTAEVKGVTFDEKGVDPWVFNIWIEQ